jgi:hypothetical protein
LDTPIRLAYSIHTVYIRAKRLLVIRLSPPLREKNEDQSQKPPKTEPPLMSDEAEDTTAALTDGAIADSILKVISGYPLSKRKKVINFLERWGKHEAAEAVRRLPPPPVQLY